MKFSFYEQVGILIPGALFLAVLLTIVPNANVFLSSKNISIGGFGVFVIIAYAMGHAIAALGNLLETIWWTVRGGMPSDWVIYADDRILNESQKRLLLEKIRSVISIDLDNVVGQTRKTWAPVFRQIQRYATANGPGRIETFNGNYGLNRGLSASLFALAVISQFALPQHYVLLICLIGAGLIYGYRMNRFGVHFAREVYLTFLNAKA